MSFNGMLRRQWAEGKFVCVGLDPDIAKIPEFFQNDHGELLDLSAECHAVRSYCCEIIDATKDVAAAYKPNAAFFEVLGHKGHMVLAQVIAHIKKTAPDAPVIYDAKRGDIGNTNECYARDAFVNLKADAITVHPYLGRGAMKPFLDFTDKGIIVLCRTSNPGAGEFQDMNVVVHHDMHLPEKMFKLVAQNVAAYWNQHGNCALVVGATYPEELAEIRNIVRDMPILIPGIGAQGGDIEKAVLAGRDSQNEGMIINASRSILFASSGKDFAEAARKETIRLNEEINQYRNMERN